ncbi:hypothetical protein [Pseudoxanthomonas sp. PXM02]|uniref:hypothetical protein n=1 Tax=Pseudoxanthomonas sp. PXM02 TaxID=2769294 RepID=UPI001785D710|nr:hypothetical protein [Pseudoxanthomonas sp. PXM02]MBD9479854.1 hypothetical protein [Pseudoxanthomonas sp. PXM02]
MSLSIESFTGEGDLKNERILIRANDEVDIGDYVLMRSKKNLSGDATSGPKSAFWFPDVTINKGDLVVVYTRAGNPSVKRLKSGVDAHFFYWRKERPIWGKEDANIAVLLEAPHWESRAPSYD